MKSRIAAVMVILAAAALVVGWVWPVHAQQSGAVRWEYCVLGSEVFTGGINSVSRIEIHYYTPRGERTDAVEVDASRGSSRPIAIAKLGIPVSNMV
jgi:hypothetical protein